MIRYQLGVYKKAVMALIVPLLGILSAAALDGGLTLSEILTAIGTALASSGLVAKVTNSPALEPMPPHGPLEYMDQDDDDEDVDA